MADDLPGFIPRVLQLDDVSLLRADEAVLNAMVDGWRAQMLARGLAVSTIAAAPTNTAESNTADY
jgi:integrase/recombinase XerD